MKKKIYEIDLPKNFPFQFYVTDENELVNVCDKDRPFDEFYRKWDSSNGYQILFNKFVSKFIPTQISKKEFKIYLNKEINSISNSNHNIFIIKKDLNNDEILINIVAMPNRIWGGKLIEG